MIIALVISIESFSSCIGVDGFMETTASLRLLTYNIGGVKKPTYHFSNVLATIAALSPDVVCAQEITEMITGDGTCISHIEEIAKAMGEGVYSFFGPAISWSEHFHPSKKLFVDMLFQDVQSWQQGNAMFSKTPFTRFSDPTRPGSPKNLPIFTPPAYLGNRNTDPRKLILSRVALGPFAPFVLGTHLTTLVGEHDQYEPIYAPAREAGIKVRWDQCQRICQIIQQHIVQQNQLAFMMGDFNATPDEPCIADMLERQAHFIRLAPNQPLKSPPIDHIFVHPGNHLVEYRCQVLDTEETTRASDHLPVYADVTIYGPETEKYKQFGPGVRTA